MDLGLPAVFLMRAVS